MARHELTDAQFALLEPLLPTNDRRGRPWVDHRKVLNGLFWKLNTGAQWRDIPERYGPWQTIYDRYVFWRRNGTWDQIMAALQTKLDATGRLDWTQLNVDGTSIRASRSAAGARKKRASTPMKQPTTPSDDRAVAMAPNSISSPTAPASRSMSSSPPDRRTSRQRLKRS